jgi:hypothetical protein
MASNQIMQVSLLTAAALGVCSHDATVNRLIVDSVDHGIRQQYQRGGASGFLLLLRCRKERIRRADALLPIHSRQR